MTAVPEKPGAGGNGGGPTPEPDTRRARRTPEPDRPAVAGPAPVAAAQPAPSAAAAAAESGSRASTPGGGSRALIPGLERTPTNPIPTLLGSFRDVVARFAERPAIRFHRSGVWSQITYQGLWQRVADLALGLRTAGVTKDDRVLVIAENSPEAIIAELATIACRAMSVILYPSYAAPVLRRIVAQVAPRIAIVESGPPLARYLEARRDASDRIKVISFGDGVPGPRGEIRALQAVAADGHRRIERCRAEGIADPFLALVDRTRFLDPIALAYTAGATRDPRGAILSHANAATGDLPTLFRTSGVDDVALIQIPLAQPFARLSVGYGIHRAGGSLAVPAPGEELLASIGEVRPTLLLVAPQALSTLERQIEQSVSRAPRLAKRLIAWALGVAHRARAERKRGAPWLVDRLILSRIRGLVGGQLRLVYVGGGADGDILSFFQDAGIDTYEGYSIAEGTPLIALNRPDFDDAVRFAPGIVGRPIDGVDVQVGPDGELRVHGLVNTRGYWRDDLATRDTLERDGWLRTGDVGYLDAKGFLVLQDRKGDMIRLADGRWVAPAQVEAALRASPLVREAAVVGRGRRFPVALVVPEFAELAKRVYRAQPDLARKASRRDLLANPAGRVAVELDVIGQAAKLPDFARPQKVRLLAMEFSDAAELTPAGTFRRPAIESKYSPQIESLYAEAAAEDATAETPTGPVPGEDTARPGEDTARPETPPAAAPQN